LPIYSKERNPAIIDPDAKNTSYNTGILMAELEEEPSFLLTAGFDPLFQNLVPRVLRQVCKAPYKSDVNLELPFQEYEKSIKEGEIGAESDQIEEREDRKHEDRLLELPVKAETLGAVAIVDISGKVPSYHLCEVND
jgi:hypothetical protein